jgi:hypothetical protein
MLFSTPTQWVVLVLCLVAGWLFGLASHPGGGKWKARYLAERDAHAGYRKDADLRAAEARTRAAEWERTHAASSDTSRAADARIAELERENARLANTRPVSVPIQSGERVEIRPRAATTAARPAYPAGERRGWFDWGSRSST